MSNPFKDWPPRRWLARFVRLLYRLRTFRDYGNRLNRSVDVESALLSVATGKRDPLSPDECRALAIKLGVPQCYRLQANDGARVPQPNHKDLWDAYVAGAKSARQRPAVIDYQIGRAADAYCKLWHATKDPEGFAAFGESNAPHQARATGGSELAG